MSVRVRFAPSPTGTLHIGGLRTALYNYLLAKQKGGIFILRIEDTDQNRYVPGAEDYIIRSLHWAGILPDEGQSFGGDKGPYRQSDRKEIYQKYAAELIAKGAAYYAFDTPAELDACRAATENFIYNYSTRDTLNNSLGMDSATLNATIAGGTPYVIRLKITAGEEIEINDLIRGKVTFHSSELDDKVLLKADGLPTYHLANIVDDHLMEITHVIRGEEWLPSTAHHVLLYRGFGWESTMPVFSHLPLILKPVGNGKLSKRDGAKFGMPVFPLNWDSEIPDERVTGFDGVGFMPEAMVNFLALLGWHPSGEQEIFTMDELIQSFSIEQIGKSGARFDYEKAKWFNQKYIQAADNLTLAAYIRPYALAKGYRTDDNFLQTVASLMKERVTFLPDFVEQGYYIFEPVREYDMDMLRKKWNPAIGSVFADLIEYMEGQSNFEAVSLEDSVKQHIQAQGAKPGDVLPLLRLALAGTMKGPAIFDMAMALGKEETIARLKRLIVVAE